jgi:predicted nucleotidyltransferase
MTSDDSISPERLPFPQVLIAVVKRAHEVGVQVVLIGATARDVVLKVSGQEMVLRRTNDVHFGVSVADMDTYLSFVAAFSVAYPGSEHKYLVHGLEVDIIPFGGVERSDRTLTWSQGTQMSTLGLSEALNSAIKLRISERVVLPVASLPALTALKIFAWNDRGYATERDAVDLRVLISAYSDGERLNDVYAEPNFGLLAQYDYEVRLVGAHLLGVDVLRDLGRTVAASCVQVIDDDLSDNQRLALAMGTDTSENISLLRAFAAGARPGAGSVHS